MQRFILKDPLKQRSSTKDIAGYIDENGCYICDTYTPLTATKTGKKGYYQITRVVNGIKTPGISLHRYAYETYRGKISEGLVVRHMCDNALCINPNHLELGTQKDNMGDMVKRGRSSKGEKNGRCKLTDEEVKEIRNLLEEGNLTQTDIGKMFNVSDVTIYYIKTGVRSS